MKKSYIPRKESIVLSAIDIIDELGIHELSTRELARRQDISDAALYRHFKSKQDIIMEVLEYYSTYDTFIINSIEGKNFNAKESIIEFFKSYAEYYENYPAITAVGLAHSVLLYDEVIANKFVEITKKRESFIIKLIKRGQVEGSISTHYDVDILSQILQGTFNGITLQWRIDKYIYSLKEMVIKAIETILNPYS